MAAPAAMYKPSNPQATDYYRCVEDHLETFIQVYEERFERTYGFFRKRDGGMKEFVAFHAEHKLLILSHHKTGKGHRSDRRIVFPPCCRCPRSDRRR